MLIRQRASLSIQVWFSCHRGAPCLSIGAPQSTETTAEQPTAFTFFWSAWRGLVYATPPHAKT